MSRLKKGEKVRFNETVNQAKLIRKENWIPVAQVGQIKEISSRSAWVKFPNIPELIEVPLDCLLTLK